MTTPVTLTNWLDAPQNRSSFQRVREVVPTARIRHDPATARALAEAQIPLDHVEFASVSGRQVTWAEHLESSYCDAVIVVHRGSIVYERYLNGMTAETLHLMMSVSKSVCGALLGVCAARGLVSTSDQVCEVAPEFAGSSADGATIQHLIDMTAGTDFVEDYDLYLDPSEDNPLLDYERQAGYRPLGARTPIGALGAFKTFGTAFAHGARFEYRSPLTNVAARVLEVASGQRYSDLVSAELWGPLGMEHDADIMLDPTGSPVVEGGMSCTARDLAKLGLAYLQQGSIGSSQVIPGSWVTDTHTADAASVRAFAARTTEPDLDDWSHYRNAFWVLDRGTRFTGIGIFGQYCWIDRPSETVIARFSSYPEAEPSDLDADAFAGFAAIAHHLDGPPR